MGQNPARCPEQLLLRGESGTHMVEVACESFCLKNQHLEWKREKRTGVFLLMPANKEEN